MHFYVKSISNEEHYSSLLDSSVGRAVDWSVNGYPLVTGSNPAQGTLLYYIMAVLSEPLVQYTTALKAHP